MSEATCPYPWVGLPSLPLMPTITSGTTKQRGIVEDGFVLSLLEPASTWEREELTCLSILRDMTRRKNPRIFWVELSCTVTSSGQSGPFVFGGKLDLSSDLGGMLIFS